MAHRGLHAYAVPSARAGQRRVPSARRGSLSRILTAGFLMVVMLAAVTIVIATPEFAEPAIGDETGAGAAMIAPSPSPLPTTSDPEAPTSHPPEKLKGYKWPIGGGSVVRYFDWDDRGYLTVNTKRVNPGLALSWFEGAWVKSPHKGEVLAAGRDWAASVGYEESMDDVIRAANRKPGKGRMPNGVVISDGNGYRSVITGLKELQVKVGDRVKVGQPIGRMARSCCITYELVRMDGAWMRVAQPWIKRDYPRYTRERVDPLRVLPANAKRMPRFSKPGPPEDGPRVDG